jgi:hypothetical protein
VAKLLAQRFDSDSGRRVPWGGLDRALDAGDQPPAAAENIASPLVQILARALLLALGQAMRKRGYEVAYSLAGSALAEPRPLDKPGEVARVLHAYEAVLAEPEPILRGVLAALRGWRKDYPARHVLWVVAEHFDADFPEDHAALYQSLRAEADQYAWFVRLGAGPKTQPDLPPPSARYFTRWQRIATTLLQQNI